MKDSVVSKVGQLIYRFSACNGCSPTHVLLGKAQIEELKFMLDDMPTQVGWKAVETNDRLRGMYIVRVESEDYCCVALLSHMGHEE